MPKRRKFTDLLQGLQPEERMEFQAFLRSPFFIKNDAPARFFERLCLRYPIHFEREDFDWAAVFNKTFPERGFNQHKLDTLLPTLARLLEQFFAVKEAFPCGFSEHGPKQRASARRNVDGENLPKPPSSTDRQSRNLQNLALAKRNISPLFQAESERLIAETEAEHFKDSTEYLALQQLHHYLYFHPDTPKSGTEAPTLRAAMENLDLHFFLDKLRYAAEMQTRQRQFGTTGDFALIPEVLEKTACPALLQNQPLIAIYHRLVRLFSGEPDEAGFQELQALVLEKFNLLPGTGSSILLHQLINYGIYLLECDCQVEPVLLTLYKKMIETESPHFGKRLTDCTFTNIVFLAAICGEFEWAEGFLLEFSPWLSESRRKDAVALAKARLCYARGHLSEAHDFLNQVSLTEHSYGARSRGLRLKIAFDCFAKEGKDYPVLLSHLSAYERYVLEGLSRVDKRKLAILNYIRFARKLAKLKFRKVTVDDRDKKTLLLKLRQMPRVISRDWLAQKIEEL